MCNPISFSVIMPCYNSAAYVETAVNSVINQSYPHWELIAINDGSTDTTLSILNQYAARDNRIKVYTKENGGYATAVNHGLNYVSNTYFLFLGSDDYLSTDLFQSIVSQISNHSTPPDCIAFRTRQVKEGKLSTNECFTSFTTVCSESNTTIQEYIECHPTHAAIFSVRDTSKCFRLSLLGDLRYFGRYGIDADGIFSMLFAHKARSFLNIPVYGYYWTIRADSVSSHSSISLEKNIDRINNWKEFFNELVNLYPHNVTSTECYYLSFPLNTLREISVNLRTAFRYHGFILKQIRFFLPIVQTYAPHLVGSSVKLISISPVIFSISCKLLSLTRKILSCFKNNPTFKI